MKSNSALEWFPKIEGVEVINTPKTIFVPYDHSTGVAVLEGDGNPVMMEDLLNSVWEACREIGLPCFVRTDMSSAKHSGEDAYLIKSISDVSRVVFSTIEDSEMKFWMSPEKPSAFMVREFVKLDAPFVGFGGLPIAHEWRFFASVNGVSCYHPYWPEEAFEDYQKGLPKNWREILRETQQEPDELKDLRVLATIGASLVGGEISIDFARDMNGKWWCFDMAKAEDSYHWSPCDKKGK